MRQTRCCIAGTCVCSRTLQAKRANALRTSALNVMRTDLFKNKVAEKLLLEAEVMLLWICHDKDKTVQHHCVCFVACQYRRPWRPTFLELRVLSSARQSLLKRCSSLLEHTAADQPLEDVYFGFEVVLDEFSGPSFKTAAELFLQFDVHSCWSVSPLYLSHRAVPFAQSVGVVKALSPADAQAVPFWISDGDTAEGADDNDDSKDDAGEVHVGQATLGDDVSTDTDEDFLKN